MSQSLSPPLSIISISTLPIKVSWCVPGNPMKASSIRYIFYLLSCLAKLAINCMIGHIYTKTETSLAHLSSGSCLNKCVSHVLGIVKFAMTRDQYLPYCKHWAETWNSWRSQLCRPLYGRNQSRIVLCRHPEKFQMPDTLNLIQISLQPYSPDFLSWRRICWPRPTNHFKTTYEFQNARYRRYRCILYSGCPVLCRRASQIATLTSGWLF